MTWRSADCPPLDAIEQMRVRRLQEQLHAVKQCADCLQYEPVQDFAPESLSCADCAEKPMLERWWTLRKARLAS